MEERYFKLDDDLVGPWIRFFKINERLYPGLATVGMADAVTELADNLADDYGWKSEYVEPLFPGDIDWVPSHEDQVWALRTSVPVCAVLEAVWRSFFGDSEPMPPELVDALATGERLP